MRAMKVFVEVALHIHPFLTATIDEGEKAPSRPGRSTRGTH